LAGCQNTAAEKNRQEVRRIAAAYETYMVELKLAQKEFEAHNPMPRRIDFGTQGSLLLRQCEIAGRPGSEVLRLKYTFFNETGISIDRARVRLVLVDPEAGVEYSQVQTLEMPFGLPIAHNSSYTSYFDMPLEDVHRSANWDWRVELESDRAPLAVR